MPTNLVILATLVLSTSALSIRTSSAIPWPEVMSTNGGTDRKIVRGVEESAPSPASSSCDPAVNCPMSLLRMHSDSASYGSVCSELCECGNALQDAEKSKEKKLFDRSSALRLCNAFAPFQTDSKVKLVVKMFSICTYQAATVASGGSTLPAILEGCAAGDLWDKFEQHCAEVKEELPPIDSATQCNSNGACPQCALADADPTKYKFEKGSVSCGRKGCMNWWRDNDSQKYEKIRKSCAVCVPLEEERCRQLVTALGYSLGGSSYNFAGDYGSSGCYVYDSGSYQGMAFFGTGGDAAAMAAATSGSKVRPLGFDDCSPIWQWLEHEELCLPGQCYCSEKLAAEQGVPNLEACKTLGKDNDAKYISFTDVKTTYVNAQAAQEHHALCRWSLKCTPVTPPDSAGRNWKIMVDISVK